MHSLLKRQVKKMFGGEDMVPESLQAFLSAVNDAYEQNDADRAMLERSLEISSEEMREAYAELRALHGELENRIRERTAELFAANELLKNEIAERKQVQIMQDAVYRIAQAAEEIQSLNELYPKIHQIIMEAMPAENFYITLYDKDEDKLSFAYYVDSIDTIPTREIVSGRGITAYVLRTGRSLLCDRATYEALECQGEVVLMGPPSLIWLGVPLIVQGRTIGVMAVQHYSNQRAYGVNEQRILEFVSSQVARAIERKRAEEELRERETRYSALIRNSVDNISLITADGALLYENKTPAQTPGNSQTAYAGNNFFARIHPDDWSQTEKTLKRVLELPGVNHAWEIRLCGADGTWRWMEGTATNLLAEPAVQAIVLNYRDVTERKETQAILDRQNRTLLALHEITPVLMGRLELDEVLKTIVQQAAQLFETPDGYLYLQEESGDELVVKIGMGIHAQYLGFQMKPGEGVAGMVWETGQPLAVKDYYTWEHRSQRMDNPTLHAIIGAPLISGSRVIGAIGLSKPEAGQIFNDEDIELLSRFAQLASVALENARLHNLVQKELTARNVAERTLRRLTDNMQDIITQVDADGMIRYASPSFQWVVGIDPETLLGRSIFEHIHPDDFEMASSYFLQAKTEGRIPDLFTVRFPHADGRYVWMECSSNILHDEEGKFAGGVLSSRDITVRKKIESALFESEKLYRLLADNSNDVIWVRDMNLRAKYISPAMQKLSGYTLQEALTLPFLHSLSPDSAVFAQQFFENYLAWIGHASQKDLREAYQTLELEMVRKDGSTVWTETIISPLLNDQGQPEGMLGVTRDITERRRAADELRQLNMALEAKVQERTEALSLANKSLMTEVNERKAAEAQVLVSLQEKEVLLKEIHHRVKNNLQIISSLLNLQTRGVTDPQTLQAMRESQMRVRSMALIHEKLYQSQSLASIDFGEYVKSLATDLFHAYRGEASGIQLNIQVEPVTLDLDHAVSCGLILNELMTNTLKYAFPEGRIGTICVELRAETERTLQLRVADDGIGIPPGFDVRDAHTLGLQLVNGLAKQLDATIEEDSSQGTSFLLSFHY